MDVEQKRIEEDLRGLISGDVFCDDFHILLYASDASVYQVSPLGVVRPRHAEDVSAVVTYAAENEIPIHARGSGSCLAGSALGRGIVLDFSRYMRRILASDQDTVRVEAGVVLDDLNLHLKPRGRHFGPDPANHQVTTIGGMVAVNASGSHWPSVGATRDHVLRLKAVLPDGVEYEFGLQDVPLKGAFTRTEVLASQIDELLADHEESYRLYRPQSRVNTSGYLLDELRETSFGGPKINLARLLCGSEGTLGLITEVTLATQPLPLARECGLFFFESIDKAALAAVELVALRPSACDLMDRRHLTLARESDPRYELLIPEDAEAVLLVECQGAEASDASNQMRTLKSLLCEKLELAFDSYEAEDQIDNEMLWRLARHFTPSLYRLKGLTRPLPFMEDIAIPPEALPEFLPRVQQILQREQITASLFAHATHGQLHFRPFLDLANRNDVRKMQTLTEEIYPQVWRVHGTISGEHGDGYSRTPFVARQHGSLMPAFRELKSLFDPENHFNPGKIIPAEDCELTANLRQVSYPLMESLDIKGSQSRDETGKNSLVGLQLSWSPEEMALTARNCNGCGTCRTHDADSRMCPIFRAIPGEEASPRAKANLARGVLTSALPLEQLAEDECRELAELCVHCHMCRIECPAQVDIPKLMIETKASHVAANGQSLHEWFASHVDMLCYYGSRYWRVANWLLGKRAGRWFIEKVTGMARNRKLPQFRRRAFLDDSLAHQSSAINPKEKVLYFVDTYANYCDETLASAFWAVLEHNGISCVAPGDQLPSAMPMIAQGRLSSARRIAERNVALLVEAVRQGYRIVATEPSATLALTHEYLQLLPGDEDAQVVAENTFEACQYLWMLHQQQELKLDLKPLRYKVGYHTPCHVKALEVGTPAIHLLGLIPELLVEHLEQGCSGIAGMYGMQRKNYRKSLRAGLPLISTIREHAFQAGVTECSTCKIQMEQSTNKPTIHPIKVLAAAYGVMPELENLFHSRSGELVVT